MTATAGNPDSPPSDWLTRLGVVRRLRLRLQANRIVPVRLPWRKRLLAHRHGFTALSWVLYELDSNDPSDYLPDYFDIDYVRAAPYRLALSDKLSFALCMQAVGARTPEPLGLIRGGRLICLQDGTSDSDLRSLLEREPRLVVKPIHGSGGVGVHSVVATEGGVEVDGRRVAARELIRQLDNSDSEELLVTAFVEQSPSARALHETSTNTLRVLTLWDEDRGKPFLAAATQRIGRGSALIDNFKSGTAGLAAPVDLETGRLGLAACLNARRDRVERHATHPETGRAIEGAVAAAWEETRREVLRVAARLPHFPYVGWDLVPTDDGPVFLEANSPPGTFVWQVHGGLLRDGTTHRAFEGLGFI